MTNARNLRSRQTGESARFDLRDSIVSLIKEGKTDIQIGSILGLSAKDVTRERMSLGIGLTEGNERAFTPAEDESILTLRNGKSRTWLSIGQLLGRPSEHIVLRYEYLTLVLLQSSSLSKRKKRECLAPGDQDGKCGVWFVSDHAGLRRCAACVKKFGGVSDSDIHCVAPASTIKLVGGPLIKQRPGIEDKKDIQE